MPELPEVETIRRDLEKTISGREIQKVKIHDPRVIRFPSPAESCKQLRGARIQGIEKCPAQD